MWLKRGEIGPRHRTTELAQGPLVPIIVLLGMNRGGTKMVCFDLSNLVEARAAAPFGSLMEICGSTCGYAARLGGNPGKHKGLREFLADAVSAAFRCDWPAHSSANVNRLIFPNGFFSGPAESCA